jgi:hypothetical protein
MNKVGFYLENGQLIAQLSTADMPGALPNPDTNELIVINGELFKTVSRVWEIKETHIEVQYRVMRARQ